MDKTPLWDDITPATRRALRKLGITIAEVREAANYEGVRHERMALMFIEQALQP